MAEGHWLPEEAEKEVDLRNNAMCSVVHTGMHITYETMYVELTQILQIVEPTEAKSVGGQLQNSIEGRHLNMGRGERESQLSNVPKSRQSTGFVESVLVFTMVMSCAMG